MGGGGSKSGQICSYPTPGWSCTYKIFANPTTDSQRKINALLNYQGFVGAKTGDDINQAFNGNYAAQYVLLFPPALPSIYVLNEGTKYDGTSRVLSPSEYTVIPNPLYSAAMILQNTMFSATSFPCMATYNVPFALSLIKDPMGSGGTITNIIYESITNPASNQCLTALFNMLETPQLISGQQVCTDGEDIFLPSPYPAYSQGHIEYMFSIGDNSLLQCIQVGGVGTNNLSLVTQILLVPSKVGPYDTKTGVGCTNITDPTCTYQICMSTPQKQSVNCGAGGVCIHVPSGTGNFDTIEECAACQKNGNCNGKNICCPQSQNGTGSCSTNPPNLPSTPSYVKDAIIGISVLVLLSLAIVLLKRRYLS